MKLLPGWQEKLDCVRQAPAPKVRTPLNVAYFVENVTYVSTAEEATQMLAVARELRLSCIGVDTEFRYDHEPAIVRTKSVYCCRGVVPLLLSVALVEPEGEGSKVCPFVVDLRRAGVLGAVRGLLLLPVTFVGHFLRAELNCLWKLAMREPATVWDTCIAERAAHLGAFHKKYKTEPSADLADEIQASEDANEARKSACSLVSTCERHGVNYRHAGRKEQLQGSFLVHDWSMPFTQEQIDYAAADAIAAAELYKPQIVAATRAGSLHHLMTIEMPWVVTNARVCWNGVRVDADLAIRVADAAGSHLAILEGALLTQYGVQNVRSHVDLHSAFGRQGLLEHFTRGDTHTFEKERLEPLLGTHRLVDWVYEARKLQSLKNDRILTDELGGLDGRMHPDHRELGAQTGRNTCSNPNVHGLGRRFRPLIVPEPGCGIGEVDLSQIEIGIAAAVFDDEALVEAFNSDDVYSAMARLMYGPELQEQDKTCSAAEFKKRHPQKRSLMKTCTLGIIYGLSIPGLALRLGTSEVDAEKLMSQFLQMFPQLKVGLDDAVYFGQLQRRASTATGLHRYRPSTGTLTSWEKNWMKNHPVQGTAAALFKVAGNRLDKSLMQYRAKLIVTLHDAFIFEAPLEHVAKVAEIVAEAACGAVRERFPQLRPRAETNISDPRCWNKDGESNSIQKWLEEVGRDSEFELGLPALPAPTLISLESAQLSQPPRWTPSNALLVQATSWLDPDNELNEWKESGR